MQKIRDIVEKVGCKLTVNKRRVDYKIYRGNPPTRRLHLDQYITTEAVVFGDNHVHEWITDSTGGCSRAGKSPGYAAYGISGGEAVIIIEHWEDVDQRKYQIPKRVIVRPSAAQNNEEAICDFLNENLPRDTYRGTQSPLFLLPLTCYFLGMLS